MQKSQTQTAANDATKAQTVPIQLQLEPTVRAALKKVAKDQGMTYAELVTFMLNEQYPEVLAKARKVEELGWEL